MIAPINPKSAPNARTLASTVKPEIFAALPMFETLAEAGKKRETIRKSVKYLAAVLDFAGVDPNPARDKHGQAAVRGAREINPPPADHVEAVYRLLAPAYRLPLLWLDWSGARVASSTRSRSATTTSATAASGCARRRRRHGGAVGRAARRARRRARGDAAAAGGSRPGRAAVPRRQRRPAAHRDRAGVQGGRRAGVLAARPAPPADQPAAPQGRSWAEIARFVGQRKLSVTADTYTHVLSDGEEVVYASLI